MAPKAAYGLTTSKDRVIANIPVLHSLGGMSFLDQPGAAVDQRILRKEAEFHGIMRAFAEEELSRLTVFHYVPQAQQKEFDSSGNKFAVHFSGPKMAVHCKANDARFSLELFVKAQASPPMLALKMSQPTVRPGVWATLEVWNTEDKRCSFYTSKIELQSDAQPIPVHTGWDPAAPELRAAWGAQCRKAVREVLSKFEADVRSGRQ